MNKFDFIENGYQNPTEDEERKIFTEPYLVRNVFGKKVLMDSGKDIARLYSKIGDKNVHYFAVRGSDDDPTVPCDVEDKVAVNYLAGMISTEDIIPHERETNQNKDCWPYRPLTEDESIDMADYIYLMDNLDLYDEGEVDDNGELVETSTINDFIHENDKEFLVCIEEVIHHNIYVKAKNEDQARYIASRKYMYNENFVNTTTEGSIDDVLIAVQQRDTNDLDEFTDLYGIYNPGIVETYDDEEDEEADL